MKFFKFIFSSLILSCLIISCKTDSSTTNQLALIPGDATIVFDINGSEIFAKSGLDNPVDYDFFGILKLLNADAYNFFESFMKGSKEAGISAEKILIYMSESSNVVISVPVTDKTSFENQLKKASLPEPLRESEFSYISIADAANIAWSENMAIFSAASTREKIAEQFKPKTDGLLATSQDFKQFVSKNSDIRLWFRYSALTELYKNLLALQGYYMDSETGDKSLLGLENFANISTHSYLNFENGKITGKASFYPPEEVEKLKEKFPVSKSGFNAEILKDMPENSYLAFNMFIDFKAYIKVIRQNIETMLSNGYMPDLEIKSKELLGFFDSPELKSITEALGGDVLVSIHGFNKGLLMYPLASVSFTVNGEDAFNNILKLIPKNLYNKQDGYYSMSIPVYFAYKDNRVFVSSDLGAIKVFTGAQKAKKTFADNPISKLMTDKMILYFNLSYSDYPENVKLLLQSFMGNKYNLFTSIIDIYDYLYFSNDAQYNMEFNLYLKNENVNSLKQILKNIDKTSSSLWMN
jgi:hypothetical protein